MRTHARTGGSTRGLPATTRGGNKREGLPRRVWRDVCASLTLTSFNANADAFTRQTRVRPASLTLGSPLTTSASLACGCAEYRGGCVFRDTQAAFSVYQVMGKFNCRRGTYVHAFFVLGLCGCERDGGRKGIGEKVFFREKNKNYILY